MRPERAQETIHTSDLQVTILEIDSDIVRDLRTRFPDDCSYLSYGQMVLVARGVALTFDLHSGLEDPVALRNVLSSLKSIPVRGVLPGSMSSGNSVNVRPPAPPIVLAAMPFDRSAPARLLLPEVLLISFNPEDTSPALYPGQAPALAPTEATSAAAVITATGSSDHEKLLHEHLEQLGVKEMTQGGLWAHVSNSFEVADVLSPQHFLDIVASALDLIEQRPHSEERNNDPLSMTPGMPSSIRGANLEKVVLARQVEVRSTEKLSPARIASRLADLEPASAIFAIEGTVGASPELLVARSGPLVRSHPLAGTFRRAVSDSQQATGPEHLSGKDLSEHRLVVDAVAAALELVCESLHVPTTPDLVHLRSVSHFGTRIVGHLNRYNKAQPDALDDLPSSLELVSLLHPTPAVAGTPRDIALRLIDELEGFDRGLYAGPVGWMDSGGDGTWMLGIRSAELAGNVARMTAGAGIVAGSHPQSELDETNFKLESTIRAITE